MEIRSINSEVKLIDSEEKRTVRGYAIKWNEWSNKIGGNGFSFVEKFMPGSFDESLRSEQPIKAFWNHNTDKVIGNTKSGTLRLQNDDIGLRFEIDLPKNTIGDDALESIRRGDVDGVSFGFKINDRLKDIQWDDSDYRNIKRTINKATLREISPTPNPAYPQTEVSLRSLEDSYKEYIDNSKPEFRREWQNDISLAKAEWLSKKHKLSN